MGNQKNIEEQSKGNRGAIEGHGGQIKTLNRGANS
jgi:hypothetical protein